MNGIRLQLTSYADRVATFETDDGDTPSASVSLPFTQWDDMGRPAALDVHITPSWATKDDQ